MWKSQPPLKKVAPSFLVTPSKSWGPVKPHLSENLVGGSTPLQNGVGGWGGAHYYEYILYHLKLNSSGITTPCYFIRNTTLSVGYIPHFAKPFIRFSEPFSCSFKTSSFSSWGNTSFCKDPVFWWSVLLNLIKISLQCLFIGP